MDHVGHQRCSAIHKGARRCAIRVPPTLDLQPARKGMAAMRKTGRAVVSQSEFAAAAALRGSWQHA